MLPTFQIGPLAIQIPGLVIILGIWIGFTVAERLSAVYQINSNKLSNMVFLALISGILGARLTYIIRFHEIFLKNPLNIFSLNLNLMDISGGIGAGLIAGLIYTNRRNMPLLATLDAFTPLLGVLMVSLSVSQLASGDAFGIMTQLPWGIELWGQKRHPTQIYYIIAGLAILTIIWPRRRLKSFLLGENGSTFLCFIGLMALTHIFIDAFRGDIELIIYNLRESQLIAWGILLVSLIGYKIINEKKFVTE